MNFILMPLNFIIFSLIFVISEVVLDLITSKYFRIPGLDFLFFAPWVAGFLYNIQDALFLTVAILLIHAIFNPRIMHYILISFPAPISAVFLGGFLGINGFLPSMIVYFVISSAIMIVAKGFGGRFLMFLLLNFVFNSIFFVLLNLFIS